MQLFHAKNNEEYAKPFISYFIKFNQYHLMQWKRARIECEKSWVTKPDKLNHKLGNCHVLLLRLAWGHYFLFGSASYNVPR